MGRVVLSYQRATESHQLSCEWDEELHIDIDLFPLRLRRERMAGFIACNSKNRLDRQNVRIQILRRLLWQGLG